MRRVKRAAVGSLAAVLSGWFIVPAVAAAPEPVPTPASPPASPATAGTGGGAVGAPESTLRRGPGPAGAALFAPAAGAPDAAAGITGPEAPPPVPGPHPSQDDGERAEMGDTGDGTPLVLGGVGLLLCGAVLARFLHGRRAR